MSADGDALCSERLSIRSHPSRIHPHSYVAQQSFVKDITQRWSTQCISYHRSGLQNCPNESRIDQKRSHCAHALLLVARPPSAAP